MGIQEHLAEQAAALERHAELERRIAKHAHRQRLRGQACALAGVPMSAHLCTLLTDEQPKTK